MPNQQYTFKKGEKLTQKQLIARLFDQQANDGSVKAYPLIAAWQFESLPVSYPAQVLLVVSKKFSGNAVDRARVKRQMREIYRHCKCELYDFLRERNQQIMLALIFTGKQHFDTHSLDKNFKQLIEQLKDNIEQRLG